LGVYKVQGITKEKFVANVIQVKMQCHHLYTIHYATKAINVTAIYRTKHGIIDNDMV
jgi:hypothetical protein